MRGRSLGYPPLSQIALPGVDYLQPGKILLWHSDGSVHPYGAIADFLGDLQSFDKVYLGPGTFTLSNPNTWEAGGITNVGVFGAGSQNTRIASAATLGTDGCIINPGDYWELHDFGVYGTLTGAVFQGPVGCGVQSTGQLPFVGLRMFNIHMEANSDGFFIGSDAGASVTLSGDLFNCSTLTKFDAVAIQDAGTFNLWGGDYRASGPLPSGWDTIRCVTTSGDANAIINLRGANVTVLDGPGTTIGIYSNGNGTINCYFGTVSTAGSSSPMDISKTGSGAAIAYPGFVYDASKTFGITRGRFFGVAPSATFVDSIDEV